MANVKATMTDIRVIIRELSLLQKYPRYLKSSEWEPNLTNLI